MALLLLLRLPDLAVASWHFNPGRVLGLVSRVPGSPLPPRGKPGSLLGLPLAAALRLACLESWLGYAADSFWVQKYKWRPHSRPLMTCNMCRQAMCSPHRSSALVLLVFESEMMLEDLCVRVQGCARMHVREHV